MIAWTFIMVVLNCAVWFYAGYRVGSKAYNKETRAIKEDKDVDER